MTRPTTRPDTTTAPERVAGPRSRHLPTEGMRTPVTTYRLQLDASLTFADARSLVPYMRDLGVTDVYLSPVLAAAPGSTHGYDVVDHTRVSEVLGGRAGLEALAADVHEAGMGLVLDIVPNHMAVPTPLWHNRALWSVLRDGPDSPYAAWFDAPLGEPVLLPILGDRIGHVLEAGDLVRDRVVVPTEPEHGEQWVLRYYDHVLPIAPGTEDLPLPELVDRQYYRPAHWRVASEETNYRRFFDVGTLLAIRVEDPRVFEESHALVLDLLRSGVVDALRVDHPDGLADPAGYFERLHEATGGAWVAAEKILAPDESLPRQWPVAGTTGYDAAWRIDQLQVDPAGAGRLGLLLRELTGTSPLDYDRTVEEAKRGIIDGPLTAEVDRLARLLKEITDDDVALRDRTLRELRSCVVELLVAAERYRVYIVPGTPTDPEQASILRDDAERARGHLAPWHRDTLDLVVSLLLGEDVGTPGRTSDPRRDELVVRFQQVCGAVTAKGVEDTAFYRWTHLTSLTEVGGDPSGFSLSPDDAHAWARRVQEAWPDTMVTTTTHDTKRGEDVRARIDVLSSYADQWYALVHRLRAATRTHRPADLDGRTENLLWQTLWGTWAPDSGDPMTAERLGAYLVKASREQKAWTTWTEPDEQRERALTDYAALLLDDPTTTRELDTFARLTARDVEDVVLTNKAVAMTWLGVVDVYRGSEVTRTSLVDPDNRRLLDPGDDGPRGMLSRLTRSGAPRSTDETKLLVTHRLAQLRAARPHTFVGARSGYRPLPATSSHVFAYARLLDGDPDVLVLVRRLGAALERLGGWGEATVVLPEGDWTDVLADDPATLVGGGTRLLEDVLGRRPVVVLARG